MTWGSINKNMHYLRPCPISQWFPHRGTNGKVTRTRPGAGGAPMGTSGMVGVVGIEPTNELIIIINTYIYIIIYIDNSFYNN